MMEMGLIFLNSALGVINQVRTAKEAMGRLSVIPVQPRRGLGQANPPESYPRDGSPWGVKSLEAVVSRRARKVAW